jgi:hypothetical protein
MQKSESESNNTIADEDDTERNVNLQTTATKRAIKEEKKTKHKNYDSNK